jgi:hypothetical protein
MNERKPAGERASATGTEAGVSRTPFRRRLLRPRPTARSSQPNVADRSFEAAYRAALFHP